MPTDEGVGDLGSEALAPVLSVDGETDAAPCVIAPEPSPAYEYPVVFGESPLRPPSLAVFRHVLINKLRDLRERLRSPEPHVPHHFGVGVHLMQGSHVAWEPRRERHPLGTKYYGPMLNCRRVLLHRP